MIAAPVAPPIANDRRTFLKLLVAAQPILLLATSLNTLNRLPQGAPQIDTQTYPDECDPTHPFHFDFYLSQKILQLNYANLSFFLRAFRRTLAAVNTVTSGASSAASSAGGSAHTHTTPTHNHLVAQSGGAALGSAARHYLMKDSGTASQSVDLAALNAVDLYTFATDGAGTSASEGAHTHLIAHTHQVVPSFVDGIWEGAVATGVTVSVNGVDRTVALGGGSGFTSSQTELALQLGWLTLGAWNTLDLTPSGLGRITAHLTVVSYIQSA